MRALSVSKEVYRNIGMGFSSSSVMEETGTGRGAPIGWVGAAAESACVAIFCPVYDPQIGSSVADDRQRLPTEQGLRLCFIGLIGFIEIELISI